MKQRFLISMKSLDSMKAFFRSRARTQDRDDEIKKDGMCFCPIVSGTVDGDLVNRNADFRFLPRKEEKNGRGLKISSERRILFPGEFYAMLPWKIPGRHCDVKNSCRTSNRISELFPVRCFFRLPDLSGKQWREPHCGGHWHWRSERFRSLLFPLPAVRV